MEFQAVLEAVRALPKDEQVRLMEKIHDDWRDELSTSGLTAEQKKEIERRLASYDADPSIGIPWEDVETHIERRLEELGE
ncbi:MAG: addiction module protein [Planctomycetes bacterium]|nr:addiction module protein [Planctomycetota bacterium]